MTTIERANITDRIRELRQRAARLRESAHHADSRQAYDDDMRASTHAENEADELEASIYDRRAQR